LRPTTTPRKEGWREGDDKEVNIEGEEEWRNEEGPFWEESRLVSQIP